jgi:hypothetical protein
MCTVPGSGEQVQPHGRSAEVAGISGTAVFGCLQMCSKAERAQTKSGKRGRVRASRTYYSLPFRLRTPRACCVENDILRA